MYPYPVKREQGVKKFKEGRMRFFSLNKMEFFLVNTHTHDMEDWGREVKKLDRENEIFFLEYNGIFL